MNHTQSPILTSLLLGIAALQGCSSVEPWSPTETQATQAAPVAATTPVAVAPAAAVSPPSVAAPATACVAKCPSTEQGTTSGTKSPTLADRYTVVAGDTLSTIAEKKEIYGDARLWPLLQRANSTQIGPDNLLSIGQILTINRNYTTEERTALIGKARAGVQAPQVAGAPKAASPAPVAAPAAPSTMPPPAVPAAATPAIAAQPAGTAATPPVAIANAEPAVTTATAAPAPSSAPTTAPPPITAKPVAGSAPATEAKAPPASADSSTITAKPGALLNAARRAFVVGDLPWSVYYYNTYLSTQKRDANAWGELGNVFFSAGNLADSAQAYFNAASILIDQGQTAHALHLVPAIEAGNPALSEAIYRRLTTARK